MNNQNLQPGEPDGFSQQANANLNAGQNNMFIKQASMNYQMIPNTIPQENGQNSVPLPLPSTHDARMSVVPPMPLPQLQQVNNSVSQPPVSGIITTSTGNNPAQLPANGAAPITMTPSQPHIAPVPVLSSSTIPSQIQSHPNLIPPNPTPTPTPTPILVGQQPLVAVAPAPTPKKVDPYPPQGSASMTPVKRSSSISEENPGRATARLQYLEYMHSVMSSVIQLDPDLPPRTNVKDDSVRLIQRHFPDTNPPSRPNPRRTSMRRCRVCYAQGIRRETKYCCNECPSQPGLCAAPCFRIWHTLLELPKKEGPPDALPE